ncbi:MAG: PpsA1 [Candidatus Aminicenantes bacterium]|nr:PpsA1 [Candidatus Aminicenantes bacterium]
MTERQKPREFQFVPRVINPVKIKRAVLLAADAELRQSAASLGESMPWLKTQILSDPASVLKVSGDEPTVFLFDDTGLAVSDTEGVRRQNTNAVLVLLSFQPFVQCSPPQAGRQKYPYTQNADLVFAVSRDEFAPPKILPAVVHAAEDRLNIGRQSEVRRFIFQIVDDEPRWFSQFLPVLYAIIGQRADVMITRTFEDSLRFLFGVEEETKIDARRYLAKGHGDDVVCLIADVFFPKGSDLQGKAGLDLIRLVNRFYPRIPVIIASKAKEAHELADLGFVLPKGDPGSLQKLRECILNQTGLGDFLIYDHAGMEIHRAKDIFGLYRILREAEEDTPQGAELREILGTYGEKDKFSTWLYMHSYRELGDRLRPRRVRGRQLVTMLRRNFQAEIGRLSKMPLDIAGRKIFNLEELRTSLLSLDCGLIQAYSDNDIISSWLDRKGYPELAEELRPIHGSGPKLCQTLAETVGRWVDAHLERG